MTFVSEITAHLNLEIPTQYQESYDNCGLLVGSPNIQIKQILVTLDVTEEVVNEAIATNCNLIIAHHPIIFKGIKSLTGKNYFERAIIKAIKNDIAIIAVHTNLDNIAGGVNFKIAEKLGLQNIKILAPKSDLLRKLTVFVPTDKVSSLTEALHIAGASNIGNYRDCSFISEGVGSFRPNENANPTIGQKNKLEQVAEARIEVIFTIDIEKAVIAAMKKAHPYEEVAYYISKLENENQHVGAGAIGDLPQEMRTEYFLDKMKAIFRAKTIRHTKQLKDTAKKIAVCGGAGSFLLQNAISQNADIFVSSDFKYHEFFDAEDKIMIADIGHYESEQYTKDLIQEIILKKFPNIAVLLSKINTNPVFYT
ncbi:MAG: Nif3-like dinuclear metal center hexameric protein [Cytophagales bacterium]